MTAEAGRFVFALARGTDGVFIVSRADAPNSLRPWLGDQRLRGVEVWDIRVSPASGSSGGG